MVKQSVKKVLRTFYQGISSKTYVKVSVGACTYRSSKELSPETGWRASRPPLWQESVRCTAACTWFFKIKKMKKFELRVDF